MEFKTHGSKWIIDPNSVNEVGCIHTCQGLEVDYVGVIIGDDLIVRKWRSSSATISTFKWTNQF